VKNGDSVEFGQPLFKVRPGWTGRRLPECVVRPAEESLEAASW